MQNDALINTVLEFTKPIANDLNLLIYYVEYVKENKDYFLRIYIDKEEGRVSLNDCENLSRRVSEVLDDKDPIKDPYYLEVSSPGLNRQLHTQEHFKRFIGRDVYVKLKSQVEGMKEIKGVLKEALEDEIIVISGENEYNIPKSKIKKANLDGEI